MDLSIAYAELKFLLIPAIYSYTVVYIFASTMNGLSLTLLIAKEKFM